MEFDEETQFFSTKTQFFRVKTQFFRAETQFLTTFLVVQSQKAPKKSLEYCITHSRTETALEPKLLPTYYGCENRKYTQYGQLETRLFLTSPSISHFRWFHCSIYYVYSMS